MGGSGEVDIPEAYLAKFKTELLKRAARIEGYDELHRLMENDKDLRLLCDVREGEKPYHPSIYTVKVQEADRP